MESKEANHAQNDSNAYLVDAMSNDEEMSGSENDSPSLVTRVFSRRRLAIRRLSMRRHGGAPYYSHIMAAFDDVITVLEDMIVSNEDDTSIFRWLPGLPGLHQSEAEYNMKAQLRDTIAYITQDLADIEDHYKLGPVLGRGHYGVVRACKEFESGRLFACKTIETKSIQTLADVKELRAEVAVLLRLDGTPNAVGLQELFIGRDAAEVHIVMEHCSGGDLFDFIINNEKLNEEEAAHMFWQLAVAVHCMHESGVVHRDLKPENILLKRNPAEAEGTILRQAVLDIRVADFGLALQLERGQQSHEGMAGSPFYMAPEIIQGKKYSHEIDVWSMGVVLFTALIGGLPFFGKNLNEVIENVLRGPPDFDHAAWSYVSVEAKDLVQQMLVLDPAHRIQTHQILLHPWLAKFCPEEVKSFALEIENRRAHVSPVTAEETVVENFNRLLKQTFSVLNLSFTSC